MYTEHFMVALDGAPILDVPLLILGVESQE